MLIDVRGFWAHDNRENLLQEEEEQVEEAWVSHQMPSNWICCLASPEVLATELDSVVDQLLPVPA
jgi:hypothetical protein